MLELFFIHQSRTSEIISAGDKLTVSIISLTRTPLVVLDHMQTVVQAVKLLTSPVSTSD